MLGLYNRFKKGQFVQEISFKHEGLPRTDLGIEKFGYVKSHAIVSRHYHEYNVVYASDTKIESSQVTLDYCLRPLTEAEVKEKLAYIANHQAAFKHFIVMLNNQEELSAYHISEDDLVKAYRNDLTNLTLTVDSTSAITLHEDQTQECLDVMITSN